MNSSALTKLAIVAVADVSFFSVIDPRKENVFILVVACVLVGVSVYAACRVVVWLLAKAFAISSAAQKRVAISVTVAVTFLVLMQSIGQLGPRDILAVVPLALVAYFYMAYASKARNQDFGTRA